MPCKEFEIRLSMLLDGEADPETQRHLESCADCRAYFDELRRADAAIEKAAPTLAHSPEGGLAERIEARRVSVTRIRLIKRSSLGLAAAFVLGFLGYLIYIENLSPAAHNIAVHGSREFIPGVRSVLRVAVDNLKTNRLGSSTVKVLLKGREIGSASAADGEAASIPISMPDLPEGSYTLDIVADTDAGHERLEVPIELRRPRKVMLTTDKPLYQPTQTVHIRLLAKDVFTGLPMSKEPVSLSIENPNGIKVLQRKLATSVYGIASHDFVLADEVVFGTYRIKASVGSVESERTFELRRYVLPKFKVHLTLDRTFYAPGQEATLGVTARYFFGKPVDVREVKVRHLHRVGSVFSTISERSYKVEGEWSGKLPIGDVEEARFEVEVRDSADHVESAFVTAAVSRDPIRIAALPYGGVFVRGQENKVYLVTTYPDGAAAKTTVRFGDRTYSSDENGVTRISSTDPVFDIEVADSHFRQGKAHIDLRPYDPGDALALYVDRVRLKGGDTVRCAVLSNTLRGTVYLDLVKHKQTLLTQALALKDGRAETAIDLPPELSGTVVLSAYRFSSSGAATIDRRPLLVDSAGELAVKVMPERSPTRPGEPISVEIRVTSNEQPVQAALGLSAVDAAVFALFENYPGLEKVFFQIEEDLMKPRWQIKNWPVFNLPIAPGQPPSEIEARLTNVEAVALKPLAGITFDQRLQEIARYRSRAYDRMWKIFRFPLLFGAIAFTIWGLFAISKKFGVANVGCVLFAIVFLCGLLFTTMSGTLRSAKESMVDRALIRSNPSRYPAEVGPSEPRVRKNFPETLYWNPELITDERGVAKLSIPAADSITTWKLAVSAIDAKGRLGAAQHDLVVFQEFFADIDLPVSLTEGDEVTIPVALYNYLQERQDLRVVLEPAEWFEGAGETTVSIDADVVASTSFRIRIKKHGWHKLLVKVYGSRASDAIERVIEVTPNGKPVDAASSDRFRKSARAVLAIPQDAIPGTSAAWMRLFPSTFSEVATGLESLVRLPYG
jgi:hypothetical protein